MRSGKPRRYDQNSERRILAQLDQFPPKGHATWTGGLLAAALPEVNDDEVWRVLRQHGISLQWRRSWCISTDPEFAAKAKLNRVLGTAASPSRVIRSSNRQIRRLCNFLRTRMAGVQRPNSWNIAVKVSTSAALV